MVSKKRLKWILIVLFFPGPLRGDGGIFLSPEDYEEMVYVNRFGQIAVILWDGEGKENLYVQAPAFTTAKNVAWIMPFPSPPHVEEVNVDMFEELMHLTERIFYTKRKYSQVPFSCGGMASEPGGENVYEILQEGFAKTLTYFIVDVKNVLGFQAFVEDRGYVLTDEFIQVAQEYIDRGFHFFFFGEYQNAEQEYTNMLPALSFSFSTTAPFYPVKPSLVDGTDFWGHIFIYVIAPRVMETEPGEKILALEITPERAMDIARNYPDLAPLFVPGSWLTKIHIDFAYQDVFLRPGRNEPYVKLSP